MHHSARAILLAGLLVATGCATTRTTPTSTTDPALATAAGTTPTSTTPTRTPAEKALSEAALVGLPRRQGPSPDAAKPPADGDYLLAPRDQVIVQVYGQDDMTRTVRLDQDGKIVLPLIGAVEVGGLTPQAAQERIEGELIRGGYLKSPRVTVAVSEFQGRQYAVVGGVNQPGTYTLRSSRTGLMAAISEAHGVRDNAEQVAYIVRGKPRPDEPQPLRVDLATMLRAGDTGGVTVEAGDVVYVPEDNTFYVTGEVEKRGAYTLRRDTTLLKALTEAGGVTKRAASDRITLIRTMPSGERKEISGIDLESVVGSERAADLRLQPQDVVVVPADGAKVVGYGFLDFLKGIFSIGIPLVP